LDEKAKPPPVDESLGEKSEPRDRKIRKDLDEKQ